MSFLRESFIERIPQQGWCEEVWSGSRCPQAFPAWLLQGLCVALGFLVRQGVRGLCGAGIWQLLLRVLQLRQATALSYTNKRVGLSREPQIARSCSAQLSADPAGSRRLRVGHLQWPFQLQFLWFCEGFYIFCILYFCILIFVWSCACVLGVCVLQ